MEFKQKFKFRILVDESFSIGGVGLTGRGICEYYDVDPSEIDLRVGSFAHAFGAAGGFSAGDCNVVDHQRLSGQAYCFSASMPALLAVTATEGIKTLDANPQTMKNLLMNTRYIRNFLSKQDKIAVKGHLDSPIIHIQPKNGSVDAIRRMVESGKKYGLFLTRSKYVSDEKFMPPNSIRLCVSADFSFDEIKKICEKLEKIFAE